MSDLGPYVEQQLANLTEDEYNALTARVRPPAEPTDPKERAVAALRRNRGLDRPGKASKEAAAAAMRTYQANKK